MSAKLVDATSKNPLQQRHGWTKSFRSSNGDILWLNLPRSIDRSCLSSRQPRLFAPSFRAFSRHLELRMRGALGWYPWRGYYSQVRANRLLRPRFSSRWENTRLKAVNAFNSTLTSHDLWLKLCRPVSHSHTTLFAISYSFWINKVTLRQAWLVLGWGDVRVSSVH